ncbi:MAG: hypothetical protein KAS15_07820 [Nanoarchaeota archaeon]|nr:hypothetical protein [Nanoarchaeota archaeon]
MGRIMSYLRDLVQIRLLVKSLLDRYARIIKNSVKLMGYVFRLILLSVNYLAALILLPIVVFFMTRLITKDYLIPSIASIAAVGIYFIFMSNYFSKGMHQFGSNAKEIKQLSYSIGVEHKLALRSLKEDNMSGSLFVLTTILILAEFIIFHQLLIKFGVGTKIRNIILGFILLQIIVILIEYSRAGHKLFMFRMPKIKMAKKIKEGLKKTKPKSNREDQKKEQLLPSNYKKSDNFDDLIIDVEPEDGLEGITKKRPEEE